ncbi:MAG: magnesium transporter [Gammaproteobacteria bacterium]|nr:magnesium transporter [Gammaproteobacteria bacterium]MDH5801538.1 magnesium transporter [Gammaproteobacteria bacterium]
MSDTEQEAGKNILVDFTDLINKGSVAQVRRKINKIHPADLAHLLESLPQPQRHSIWELIKKKNRGDVLASLHDDVRTNLIQTMEHDDLVTAVQSLPNDDLADILEDIPEEATSQLLQSMDEQRRQRLEAVMSYPEDTAGGLMNTDTITVREDTTLDVVQRYLRLLGEIPQATDNLIVINREGTYIGTLALTDLLIKDPGLSVGALTKRDSQAIDAHLPQQEVAHIFSQRDLISAPVVDSENKLLGRITIDDVVDVIREESDHSLMSMAGLNEEDDMFASSITSSRRRSVWLGINLLTALLASWVIGLFGQTIEQLVALAILMPIVASMGGIAGSQTLTLVIRGLALGKVSPANAMRLINKEARIGLLNGLIWSLVVAAIAVLWFGNEKLGLVIGMAMIANLVVAALAGASIPIVLQKFKIDPALAGGVVLTTVTDVIGFLVFLGLAALYLV